MDYNSSKLKKNLFINQREINLDSSKRIDLLKDWLYKKLEIDFSISTAFVIAISDTFSSLSWSLLNSSNGILDGGVSTSHRTKATALVCSHFDD